LLVIGILEIGLKQYLGELELVLDCETFVLVIHEELPVNQLALEKVEIRGENQEEELKDGLVAELTLVSWLNLGCY